MIRTFPGFMAFCLNMSCRAGAQTPLVRTNRRFAFESRPRTMPAMLRRYFPRCHVVAACFVAVGFLSGSGFAQRAAVAAERGMVTSAHALASEAGLEMLQRGGNAV